MARRPYRTARQEHLADALDELQSRGVLRWRWQYDSERNRAVYHVTQQGEPERALDTKDAERAVSRCFDSVNRKWLPVPNPGGESQREDTLRKIAEM